MSTWLPCPYAADYRFDIGHVRALWPALHAVDAEPTPHSDALWHAWALFHSGQFEQATDAGLAVGVEGLAVANRATAAHAASSLVLPSGCSSGVTAGPGSSLQETFTLTLPLADARSKAE